MEIVKQTPEQRWYATRDDAPIGDHAPTPEAAARHYFQERPDAEFVEVMRALVPTHAELVSGLGGTIAEHIACAMADIGGDYAEDDARAVEYSADALEELIAPVAAEWLRRRVPTITFWAWDEPQTFTREEIQATASAPSTFPGGVVP